MVQGIDQRITAIAIVEQVIFEIRIALHDPDVAQNLVEHASGTAGDALGSAARRALPNCRRLAGE